MSSQTGWFIVGLIMLGLLATYVPKVAGLAAVVLIAYLAVSPKSAHLWQ